MTLVLYPLFHGFDQDGLPLEGGLLHSYLPGTSTPAALFSDPSYLVPGVNPGVLDDRGEALLYTPRAVDLVLTTADDVQLWGPVRLDPAQGGSSGGTRALAPILVNCFPGAQLIVPIPWPEEGARVEGVLTRNVTALGTSHGLTGYAIGYHAVMDAWGTQDQLYAGAVTTMGDFGSGAQPILTSLTVLLAALGGLFDGVGQIEVTVFLSELALEAPVPPEPEPEPEPTTGQGVTALTPVLVSCTAGLPQLAVPIPIPAGGARLAGVLTRNVVSVGATQGITGYQVGDAVAEDTWGTQEQLVAGAGTVMGDFASGNQPIVSELTVLLTAQGGLFDGVGQIEVIAFVQTLPVP